MGHVQKRGAQRYRARLFTPEGRERSRTFKRKVDAQAWLVEQEGKIQRGEWIDPSRGRITFSEWWETYDRTHPRAPKTMERDRGAAKVWLLPHLGRVPMNQIQPADVRRLVDAMMAKLSPSTVRTYYGVLQAAMNAAVESDVIARTPCRGIKLSSERRKEPRFLSMDELHHLGNHMPVEYRPMVYVAGLLGLRFAEVAGLRVKRLDFLRRTISVVETVVEVGGNVEFAPTKTKMSRRAVTAPPALMEMLAEHLHRQHGGRPPDPEGLVFTAPQGGPLYRKKWRQRVWLPAVKAATLDDLTFHGLRHSAAGFMIELGAHPRVMQQRMGHASIRTTMDTYGSVLPEVDAAVTDGLGQLLAGPGDGLQTACAQNDETPGSSGGLVTRGFSRGAEGSRTPGLLDATEAL